MTNYRKQAAAWADPDNSPRMSIGVDVIYDAVTDGGWVPHQALLDTLMDETDLAEITCRNLVDGLRRAGWLVRRGQYHQSRHPRRLYQAQRGGGFFRDLRAYRIGNWGA